jgi:hypothetical protein
MAELHSFDEVALLIKHRTEQILDRFATDILVTVRERTPIDTGNARAGWVREPAGLFPMGTTFSIGNDVEYIEELEFGKSKQAPHGMARITAAESQVRLDAAVVAVVGG